MTTFILIFVY